jgi:SAM-dependent methyltransferase
MTQGRARAEFDEAAYLHLNPDVAAAVARGNFASGWDHFVRYGFYELRAGTSDAARRTASALLAPPEAVPPHNFIGLVGGGGAALYHQIGLEFFSYFVNLADLRPDQRVLDIGCGCGRIAQPLARYLDASGGYEGFDIVPELVHWCQENITSRWPHFTFQLVPLRNQMYRRAGASASAYRFPYANESFDLVVATSVFTHMLPADVENYTREISRVLRRGGRALITFFLLTPESTACMAGPASMFHFKHAHRSGYRCADKKNPEAALAYPEATVRELFARHGLGTEDIRYGVWSGRPGGFSGQDITVSVKV